MTELLNDFLTGSVAWGVLLTLAAFGLGVLINRVTGKAIFNPLLLGSIFVIIFLSVCNIPYGDYKTSAAPVSYLLLPATVALAIPLYEKLDLLKANAAAIIAGISVGTLVSLGSALALALALHLTQEQYATLLPKSVTTAISMDVAAELGGIAALKKGVCHMAGMHLLEEDSGDFNFAFLRKFYPEGRIVLLNLAIRRQGLIVPAGNPKGVRGVEDLKGKGLRYINRQRGAGTRILFDWHLRRAGLKPADVDGYAKEESTHMAVAVNVLTGAADCGMGIYAAARALGLDFVPLARERYDLAVPERFWEDPRILAVRDMLQTKAFKARLENLGGYETGLTGQIMHPGVRLGE